MKPFSKFVLFVAITLAASMTFLVSLYFLSPSRPRMLYQTGFLQLKDSDRVHFTREGAAISIPHSVFYSPKGFEIEPPFYTEDFIYLPLGFEINKTTDNYMLIENTYLFNTSVAPFEMIWETEEHFIWDIIEFSESRLLVLTKTDDIILPNILDVASGDLIPLSGFDTVHYIDAAQCPATGSFSLLAFSDREALPAALVYHYAEDGSLQGALRLDDSVLVSIYRIGEQIVLIGTNQVICYNDDGTRNWSYDIPKAYLHSDVIIDESLWLYFPHTDLGYPNALRISYNADREWREWPRGMTEVQRFRHGIAGLMNNKEVLLINVNGVVSARFVPGKDILSIYWDEDLQDYLFAKDRMYNLITYSFNKPENTGDLP